ncbi:dnaJ homolog subfamily C member 28 [Varanus komodoensis]|uniref:DnaJ heat shock protein family (Hsp40) member C28 n=1 Tax=Varanus komodoensis TaxID=61221 RepID=A0A8D2JJM3_VARKO|nr:dnaJ homolog subfamily C member 28 [Varanus komodoensis]XP_044297616.1 dnaJ homolog subfamily C member 28 [Varanus komodoensis]XP_044297618.1 dnaJ homolog subfamily C member 28 [Varanus komodoensis]XP_044297619.1 dnaJ homolog subfamily C member 28 [Varanus komodoensis]XP_044297620.1 dnaJ homolog subfamily C member 28 [Varanus komodoensis]XP_044297621.1 dnaJ homolog subfamily C member 28 [Varanus komodoensis]XP_044297622.1 dnaJ homolog subfamily C member 28 [Varanus komodoensis]XP_04429762
MKLFCAVLLRKIQCRIWICSALVLKKDNLIPHNFIYGHRLLSDHRCRNIKDSYSLLQLQEGCSLDDVRNSYRDLAKKYHPDSGSPTADSAIFVQIEDAYRVVLNDVAKNIKLKEKVEDDEDDKFKPKTPQHRQYLSFEGIGYGTPSQRERQYMQFRVDRASEQVTEYRKQKIERQLAMSDAILVKDVRQSKKAKITQAIERLVEDLIQESMAKGDFDNLSGKGKPLQKFSDCPHIDPMTHNLNRILIDNGYQPEWILLQKEIRETIEKLRKDIVASRSTLGDPMTPQKEKQWKEICEQFIENIKVLNKKINNFNLVVPILSRQMVHFNASKEIARAQEIYISTFKKNARKETQNTEDKSGTASDIKNSFLKWMNLILK